MIKESFAQFGIFFAIYNYSKYTSDKMKRIKIKKPNHKVPLENMLSLYKRELNTRTLESNPSYENKIIQENKKYFSHIGVS